MPGRIGAPESTVKIVSVVLAIATDSFVVLSTPVPVPKGMQLGATPGMVHPKLTSPEGPVNRGRFEGLTLRPVSTWIRSIGALEGKSNKETVTVSPTLAALGEMFIFPSRFMVCRLTCPWVKSSGEPVVRPSLPTKLMKLQFTILGSLQLPPGPCNPGKKGGLLRTMVHWPVSSGSAMKLHRSRSLASRFPSPS